jgi:5-methylcytosine-specific restriction enzyme subunit McrC
MRTDLVLHFGDRRLIVDTKYYRKALQENRGSLKLHSGHLYQICAYVRSLEAQEPGPPVEGMLLYPVVEHSLAHRYVIDGHVVRVRSVNLAQPRDRIRADLLESIA